MQGFCFFNNKLSWAHKAPPAPWHNALNHQTTNHQLLSLIYSPYYLPDISTHFSFPVVWPRTRTRALTCDSHLNFSSCVHPSLSPVIFKVISSSDLRRFPPSVVHLLLYYIDIPHLRLPEACAALITSIHLDGSLCKKDTLLFIIYNYSVLFICLSYSHLHSVINSVQ